MTKEPEDFGFSIVETMTVNEPSTEPTSDGKLDRILLALDTVITQLDSIAHQNAPTAEEKTRLQQLEEIIVPIFDGLAKNPEYDYIKWPNRKPIIDAKMKEILKLTRG